MQSVLKETPVAQCPEQRLANSEETVAELKALAAPLVEWIRSHHGPHTQIHISWDYISVKHDGVGIPFSYSE